MSQRPESVTVIAWLLIVFGAFGLMGSLAAWTMRDLPMLQPLWASYHLPYAVVMAATTSSLAVHMLCAIGFLMRVSWSRHVYVISALATVGFAFWVSPWPQFEFAALLFPAVATILLYRPSAEMWFRAQETAASPT